LVIVGDSSVRFLVGDARSTIAHVKDHVMDAIFFDPFSPKVCPHLWTEAVFTQCRRVIRDTGVLATYSYARAVREALTASGFTVSDGPVVGRRSPSTLARPRV
ncbi:MAG TPA: MnmC family methyltransferase, partial [Acidobacteriota bacterium]|nr:MnmC family methyltransferase [Acidobacteriota bacterium]